MQITSAEEAINEFETLTWSESGMGGSAHHGTIRTRRQDGTSRTPRGILTELRRKHLALTVSTPDNRCVPALGVYRYDRPDGSSYLV